MSKYNNLPEKDEVDTPNNPYDEPFIEIAESMNRKLHMESSTHTYLLIDGNRAYPGRIISGSKMLQFASILDKPEKLRSAFASPDMGDMKLSAYPSIYLPTGPSSTPPQVLTGRMAAMSIGTLFHWYAEQRILGNRPEVPKEIVSPVAMFEKFYGGIPENVERFTEVPVASFRHKVCGHIDFMLKDPETNELNIVDFKLSQKIFEKDKPVVEARDLHLPGVSKKFIYENDVEIVKGFKHRVYVPMDPDANLFGYMVQQATYRKLNLLNSKPTSPFLSLAVPARDLQFVPGIPEDSIRIVRFNVHTYYPKFGSPSGVTEWIFHERERRLKHIFRNPIPHHVQENSNKGTPIFIEEDPGESQRIKRYRKDYNDDRSAGTSEKTKETNQEGCGDEGPGEGTFKGDGKWRGTVSEFRTWQ